MRTNLAILFCLASVLYAAGMSLHRHHISFSGVELAAFVWCLSGLWLAGQLRRFLDRSPGQIYMSFRTGDEQAPPIARLMINGGLVLGAINLVLWLLS